MCKKVTDQRKQREVDPLGVEPDGESNRKHLEGLVLLQIGPVPENVGVAGRKEGEGHSTGPRVVEADEPGVAVEVSGDLAAASHQVHLDELSGPDPPDELVSVLFQTGQVIRVAQKSPDFWRPGASPDDDGLSDQLGLANDLVVAMLRQQLDELDVGADGQQVLAVLRANATLAFNPDVLRVEQNGARLHAEDDANPVLVDPLLKEPFERKFFFAIGPINYQTRLE